MRKGYKAARIFTGDRLLEDHAVVIDGAEIVAVLPLEACEGIALSDLGSVTLAPGFIDVQVNGGGGVLFNASPDVDSLAVMARAHARHGTTAMLPTFITDRPEVMATAIDAVRDAIKADVPGVIGLHLEGPFLALSRKGAHDPDLIRPLSEADLAALTSTGLDQLLVTLAPEAASPATIGDLAGKGVLVSLGHSDATFDQAMQAADAGARGVTHLFNAMSQLQGRTPGLVGATLAHGGLWGGVIADGFHVHAASLDLAVRSKRGPGRLFLVTDAMPTAGHDGDVFELNGRKVTRHNGRLTLEDGTLAGSDLTMDRAVAHMVHVVGIGLEEALRMASLYPATFLGVEHERGRIAAGYRADMVALDADLHATATWIGGALIA